ncbi:MAG: hypothetical protein IH600_03190 [Bacteroidetes bacterium]|nr:hypothetical protein [Bacteroidota bacterium]
MSVGHYSSVEFHCDNSVHGNVAGAYPTGRDVIVYDGSRAVGWGNYPDSSATTPDSIRFIKYGNAAVQWDDPSDSLLAPNEDPVLMKSFVQSPFVAAFTRAHNYARQGLYQMAQADFSLALSEAGTRSEYVLALHAWRRMVNTADRDSTAIRSGYQSSYWNSLVTALTGKAMYADSSWMREIAGEVLTLEKISRMDTASVENTLRSLISTSSNDGVRRRSLLRLVFFDCCIRTQYASAYSTFQTLDGWYPHSDEAIYAKILLRIPLDSADVAAMGKAPEVLGGKPNGPGIIDDWLIVKGPWPTPQADLAKLRVYASDEMDVERSIYDIRGARVRTEPSTTLNPGWNDMTVKCSGLSSGTYLFVLEHGTKRKSILLNILRGR